MKAAMPTMHASEATSLPAEGEVCLSAQNLSKQFGGLTAVNDVSLSLRLGEIHAVIGPNGAGKSTLTHLLSGDLKPSGGSVSLSAVNVTGWSPERIARQGLGRSFQKTNVFLPFTVWDNVRLAAQASEPRSSWHPRHWLAGASNAAVFASTHERTQQAIALARLGERTHAVAGTMSHGEQRQLEIALALATQPRVLLLDEPLAGMGVNEAQRMIELLQSLKARHAMLLVEHDMDAVFALADVLTVMVNGVVIASGTPADIRNDAKVQAAYLGESLHD